MPSNGANVGPIIFANEIARSQLVNEGEVVSFRQGRRTTGETWWRKSRTSPKEGDVLVEEIGPVDPGLPCSRFEAHADLSGFASADEWREAIYDLYGRYPDGYLYRVTERGRDA
ncbi:hypothetical protein [Salinilacihabitans rarus]|uniref:hypothetical protein n=1 Tax=Salinilacihabitans rarus TaxID=2961596 RepID=UPI0020C902BE|nr:hypothetical protein [Salinilacihabitans rarus]